ncbi:TIGR03619 family F420-dependent LLM class oxidoreductase [Kribbella sp. NPDC026611]|uniref:LLM class flavin-dependent oxidoreductase n=1 Tax=Kribbella sp. NPDC026611 TaxID=3154911 RepID=UPI0033C4C171
MTSPQPEGNDMLLGIALPTYGDDAGTEAIVETAERAERIGLDSVWTYERILRPTAEVQYAPGGPSFPLPDFYKSAYTPLETLAFVAARTSRVRLGTSIVNALFHAPAILGRRFATLDQLSGGRVVVGLGQAWMKEEFETVGVPMKRRGAGFSEYLEALRAVWAEDPVSFSGRFYEIAESDVNPKPVQVGGPPIVVGTASPAGLERAGRAGVGINLNTAPLDDLKSMITTFKNAAAGASHDPDVQPIVIRVNEEITPQPLSGDRLPLAGSPEQIAEDLQQLEALGVTEAFWSMKDTPWRDRVPAVESLLGVL